MLAIRLRLGGLRAPPKSRAVGDGVRRFALLGLLAQAVTGTMSIAHSLWPSGIPTLMDPGAPHATADASPIGTPVVAPLMGLAWLVAFLGLTAGRSGFARASASIAFLLLGGRMLGLNDGDQWLAAAPALLLAGTTVLAMAGFHEDAPRLRGAGWVIGYLTALSALLLASVWFPGAGASVGVWVDLLGLYVIVVVALGVAHVAQPWTSRASRSTAWSVALACFAGTVAAARLLSLATYAPVDDLPPFMGAALRWQAAAAAVIAIGLTIIARRSLDRLSTDFLR